MNNFPNDMNSANTFPNNKYPPYGYNDNNFNRKRFPSNIYPNNGGQTGSYFNQFNPLSTNTQKNMQMTNFPQAFKHDDTMIEKSDYRNKGDLLHNNVGENVLDEHVVEYRINIDSLDRDISTYLDPFHFTVKFNPPGPTRVQNEVYLDKSKKSSFIQETRFDGLPQPHINKEFRNVKYIKLENVVLPLYSGTTKNDEDKVIFDPDSLLIDDRFLSLVIKELEWDRTYTTSDSVTRISTTTGKRFTPARQFAIILPDKLNKCYFSGVPFYGSRIYKNSLLGNLKQMTLDFRDSCGEPIRYNDLFTVDELIEAEENGTPVPLTDLRHPLNKKINLHLSFVIGVVESQINTNTKFEI